MFSDTYDIESKGEEHFIEFCDVEAADAGEYSCTATNSEGSASTSCMLGVVIGKGATKLWVCVFLL